MTLWFDDKSKIVDRGNEITAHAGTPLDNGRRVVNLAKLKGWKSIKLSGSDAFVEEAMRKAFAVGLDVSPTEDQRELWKKIQAEATATTAQVMANTNTAHVVPTLAGLGEKLGRRGDPSAHTPKRGRGLGL